LRHHAASAPQRTAIVGGATQLSYGEVEQLANRMAAVLRRLGLARGDHLASLIGNRPQALALAWAAWRSGLYLTPMSTALAPAELRYLVDDCDAKAVVVDADLQALAAPLAAPTAKSIHWLSLGVEKSRHRGAGAPARRCVATSCCR